MDYLARHYKNLAEQLQYRINHIQQCLYEMNAPPGGLNDPSENEPSQESPETQNPTQDTQAPDGGPTPGGIAPWRIIPAPPTDTTYTWFGRLYKYVGGGWVVQLPDGTWDIVWCVNQDVTRPDRKPTPSDTTPVRPRAPTFNPPAGTAPATTTPRPRPRR